MKITEAGVKGLKKRVEKLKPILAEKVQGCEDPVALAKLRQLRKAIKRSQRRQNKIATMVTKNAPKVKETTEAEAAS